MISLYLDELCWQCQLGAAKRSAMIIALKRRLFSNVFFLSQTTCIEQHFLIAPSLHLIVCCGGGSLGGGGLKTLKASTSILIARKVEVEAWSDQNLIGF